MSLSTAKKRVPPFKGGAENSKKQAMLENITEIRRLDDRYFLVKIDDLHVAPPLRAHIVALGASLPEIPVAEVRRLLIKYADGPPSSSDVPPNRPVSPPLYEAIPPENQAFMDELHAQSMVARERHLREGRLMTADQFRQALGITRQAVSKAVDQLRMFSLDGPAGKQVYPGFFTDAQYDRRTLERVCQALGDLPGPSKWQFFTTGKASLHGRTPLEAIANGHIANVIAAATGFKER